VHIKFRSTGTQTHISLTPKCSCNKLQTHDLGLEKCGGMGSYISKHVDIVFMRDENRKKSLTPIKADMEQNIT
jgi:hypothetical protein